MGSFGAPTKNLGSRSLPQLRPSPSKAAAFRGSEAKRLKLEALRRANDDDKLARAKRAAAMARRVATPLRKSAHFPGEAAATVLDPGPCEPSQSSKPGSAYGQLAPASREARLINDVLGPGGSASRSRRSQTPKTPDVGPVDWRVLAACEVVLDREDEVRRSQAQKDKVVSMHKELQTQLERNAARRADERREKQDWMRAVREETAQIKAAEEREKRLKHEKRMADREMFREQARLQREKLLEEKARNAAAEKREIDAARASLKAEEARVKREKETNKAKQETLRLEILEERRVKQERRLAEWRETERIEREAERARLEEERRRREISEKREATINKFTKLHEAGAGKRAADLEQAEQDRVERYLAAQARKDEARHFSDLEKIRDTNAKIRAENDSQIARRRAERDERARQVARDAERMRAMTETLHDEEARAERERFEKQRNFQKLLEEQAATVRERKRKEQVAMNDSEHKLNDPFVKRILADPERKKELKKLIF